MLMVVSKFLLYPSVIVSEHIAYKTDTVKITFPTYRACPISILYNTIQIVYCCTKLHCTSFLSLYNVVYNVHMPVCIFHFMVITTLPGAPDSDGN